MQIRIPSMVALLALGLAPARPVLAQAEAAPVPADEPTVPAVPAPAAASVPAPVVPAPSPAPTGHNHGWVLLPFLGMNVPVGDLAQRYAPGLRFGLLAGWHLGPRISLDGEATLDLMDAEEDASFLRPREHTLDLALSPLIHLRSGTIVAGPKLGWFNNRRRYPTDAAGNRRAGHHGQGFVVGLNLGAFTDVGGVRLGMLASVVFRRYLSSGCDTGACGGLLDPILLGLSVAALF